MNRICSVLKLLLASEFLWALNLFDCVITVAARFVQHSRRLVNEQYHDVRVRLLDESELYEKDSDEVLGGQQQQQGQLQPPQHQLNEQDNYKNSNSNENEHTYNDVSSEEDEGETQEEEICKVIEQCRLCTDTDKEKIPECSKTGRIETRRCGAASSFEIKTKDSNLEMLNQSVLGDNSKLLQRHLPYQNVCHRTVADEEFLLVRFQVFCFLTGAIAFMSVRKQKAQYASLFDQRYMNSGVRRNQFATNKQQQQQQAQQQQASNKRRKSGPTNKVSGSGVTPMIELVSSTSSSVKRDEMKSLLVDNGEYSNNISSNGNNNNKTNGNLDDLV